GMFVQTLTSYNQKKSFRVAPQTKSRHSLDVCSVVENNTNNTVNNLNANTNNKNNAVNHLSDNKNNNNINNKATVPSSNHGPGTTAKERVKPSRSGVGGGMGPRPKSTL